MKRPRFWTKNKDMINSFTFTAKAKVENQALRNSSSELTYTVEEYNVSCTWRIMFKDVAYVLYKPGPRENLINIG